MADPTFSTQNTIKDLVKIIQAYYKSSDSKTPSFWPLWCKKLTRLERNLQRLEVLQIKSSLCVIVIYTSPSLRRLVDSMLNQDSKPGSDISNWNEIWKIISTSQRCSSIYTSIFVRRKDKINYLSNQTWAKCYHLRNKH